MAEKTGTDTGFPKKRQNNCARGNNHIGNEKKKSFPSDRKISNCNQKDSLSSMSEYFRKICPGNLLTDRDNEKIFGKPADTE